MNTKNNQTKFSKESIDIYLKKLSKVYKKLSAGRMPAEIILVGGSAIAVNYSFRQSSTDIDAIIQAPDVMRDAICRINITEIRDACEKLYGETGYDTMPAASRKLVENAISLNKQELRNLYRQQTKTESENCRLLVQFEADHPGVLSSENLEAIIKDLRKPRTQP